VRDAINGSRESYGLLVVRYSRSVRATCLARLGLRSDLDDLVQETFLRAYRGLARVEDPSRFASYVHRIAKNICVDELRRRDRNVVSLDQVDLAPPAEPASDVREERLHKLRQFVGRMPEALREAILLFYFEQNSHAAIASMLGITEAAVNQRLHRARVFLKQSFAEPAADGGGAT
jgi:RNA polymerase sigma-70 factor (ECF subfamily)